MEPFRNVRWKFGMLSGMVAAVLAVSLACAGDEAPAPQPQPTARPAPTVAPAPTATPRPAPTATPTQVVSTGPQTGGVLRFAARPLSELRSFDPVFRAQFGEYHVDYLLYDNLVVLDPGGNIQPELARGWNISDDGRSVTFNLEQGVQFQDGTAFNAEAVKWNMERTIDPEVQSTGRNDFLTLTSVDVVDDSTVRFNLTEPWRPLLASLTLQGGWMASPTAVQTYNGYSDRLSDFGKNPTGTGPFTLRVWDPGQRVVVDRDPGYWKEGLPYLDGVDFIGAPNEVKMAMIRTNEADLMELSPWAMRELRKIEGNPNVKAFVLPSGRHHYVEFDTNWGALQDKNVRQAMGFAIDRETAVDVIFDGRGTPAYGPENTGWWAYDPDEMQQVMKYDTQKARQLLSQAGYADGLTLPMWCRADGEAERAFCEFWQAMMRDVGITVDMTLRPYADIIVARNEGLVRMESFWFTPRGDVHGRFGIQFHSTGWGNFYGYNNPEVDRLIEEAATVFDIPRARQMYRDLQKMVIEDASRVFTAHPDAAVVTTARVQNFQYAADMILRMQDLWLSQ